MISLSARIGWSAAVVLAVFIVLTALALERAFADSAAAAQRERLFAQLYLVMAATEVSGDRNVQPPATLGDARFALPGSGLYARIDDEHGKPLWRSPSALGVALPETLPVSGEYYGRQTVAGERHFVAAMRVNWETHTGSLPLTYSVYEHPAVYHEQMARYRRSLWGWLGAMAALLLGLLAAAVAWGLRPLRAVAAELRAIEAGAQPALQGDYPREIRLLSDNINTLLHHEHAQQARYKHALADLAHSLKTPLAILRGIDAGVQAPLLEEQVARMDGIVQHQLQRAATAGRAALAPPLALAPLLQRLLSALYKVHADKPVTVQQALDEGVSFRAVEGDAMELLGNLLENAFKWCRAEIRIGAVIRGARLHITIEDDGPGIAPEAAEQVLQRGARLDETTPGHGIGLAMAHDIVNAYDGELKIGRSALGGAMLEVILPG